MKLIDLDPQFLRRTAPIEYELTDDIREAHALRMKCPACHWSTLRCDPVAHVHEIVLWKPDPPLWEFAGHGYKDLTLAAGRLTVTLSAGHCAFYVSKGKVHFS